MKKFQSLAAYSLLGIGIASLFSIALYEGIFSSYRAAITDNLYANTQSNPHPDIAIIAIDDASIKALGRWPLPRTTYARLLNILDAASAQAVGIDIAFTEKSGDTAADQALITAITSSPRHYLARELEGVHTDPKTSTTTFEKKKELLPGLESHGSLAVVNTPLDSDGVFRATSLQFVNGSARYDSLAYELFTSTLSPISDALSKGYHPPARDIFDPSRLFFPRFSSTPGSLYSLADVLDNKVSSDAFKDKLVLIGATATNLHDEQKTPLSSRELMPGVLVHANILKSLLEDSGLHPAPFTTLALIIFLLGVLTALFVGLFRPLGSIAATIGVFVAYIIATSWLFDAGYVLDILYPFLVIIFTFAASFTFKYLREEKQKQWIRFAFSHYLSPEVIKEILKNPAQLRLGGQRKEVSILFSDIRNFTAMSEKVSAEELVLFLNQYLTRMSSIVMDEKGTVDKYIGDAIMAFWGAPLENLDHPINACRAALQMMAALPQFREDTQSDIDIGLGINSGEVVVGNIGSTQRFDYTVIGDNVNLASRLEGLCKPYGVKIIISENTHKTVADEFICRRLDYVAVKGKTKPIMIYELISAKTTEPEPHFVSLFHEGLDAYFSQDWSKAMGSFQKVLVEKEGDIPAQVFIDRCHDFKNNPPSTDWDKVFVLKTK